MHEDVYLAHCIDDSISDVLFAFVAFWYMYALLMY